MPVIRELLARELLMLVVLAAIGAGPASLLSTRFRAIERAALAPILGMCLGTCVFTTLIYFFPANDTNWLVPVLAVASLALAAARSRTTRGWWRGRANIAGWLSIALVIIIVTAPILSVMRSQHTIGPASYAVGDAAGYVAETDADVHLSLHDAARSRPPYRNLVDLALIRYSRSYQNLDLAPLSANVDSLTGLGSTDTWEAFLIAFVVAGALGALAAVRWALRDTDPAALTLGGFVAGGMFAGALFVQLVFAGSQSGLCGLSLLLPLGVLAADAVIEPRPQALALVAVVSSGLMAIYPLFVAPVAATGAAVLLFLALRRWRAGPGALADIRRGGLLVAAMVALAACVDLVCFFRDLRYWTALVDGGFNSNTLGFPVFDMKFAGLPEWLFQTRDLFTLTTWAHASVSELLDGLILPLAFIAIIIAALRRLPILCWLLGVIIVAAALGEYEAAKSACPYCTDRSLLPIAPMLLGLLAVGLGVLWASKRRLAQIAGLIALVAWCVPAFGAARELRGRVKSAGVFLDSSDRVVLGHLPNGATVDVEGFDADPAAASPDTPFAYELAEEHSDGHATLPGDVINYGSIAYLGGASRLDAGQFNPYYRYVLTRLPGIATARRTLFRSDGVALQERLQPLDVVPDGGLFAPPEQQDPTGSAIVPGATPLRLVVAGPGTATAYVGVRMTGQGDVFVPSQPGVEASVTRHGLTACIAARGTAPFRLATLRIAYRKPPPSGGLLLQSIAVAGGRCPYAGSVVSGDADRDKH